MNPSILLMDNTIEFLDTQARLFEYAGYRVVKARTVAEAERILQEDWVHLAIFDVRMEDENDGNDINGLVLARKPEYRAVPKIILTAYPTHQGAAQALGSTRGDPSAVDYIAKGDDKLLLETVQNTFIHHVRINWDLQIDWQSVDRFALVNFIEPDLEGSRRLKRVEEIEDLFRRLFYEKEHLRIDRLLWRHAGCVALAVLGFKAGMPPESFVVVCGQNARVLEETRQYQRFAPKAPGVRGTLLSAEPAETTHFGANALILADADLESVQSLEQLYRGDSEKLFHTALRNLFGETLAAWHQGTRILGATTTFEWYRVRLGMDRGPVSAETFNERVQAIVRQMPLLGLHAELRAGTLKFDFDRFEFVGPDPFAFLFQSFAGDQPLTLLNTSGRLSSDTIVADPDGHTWLTDFERAGPAPLGWNWSSLEALIRFDWINEKDLRSLYEMETRLVSREFAKLDTRDLKPLLKPMRAIQIIRELAARGVGKETSSYHLGILFQAARRIADFDPHFPLSASQLARLAHALLAAAMICRMLDKPALICPAPPHVKGLRLNKAKRTVEVDGTAVDLSKTEFDLLVYLYDHRDRVCLRADIAKAVYHDGEEFNEETGGNRLNTEIGRLRQKISPDDGRSSYLVTERGVGYRLKLPDIESPET